MTLPLGLRTRFFLYSNTLIVATMVLVAIIWVRHERSANLTSIERVGRGLAEVMTLSINHALSSELASRGDVPGQSVEVVLARVVMTNHDLVHYVVVTDTAGMVTHSNRKSLIGVPFVRSPSLPTKVGGGVLVQSTERESGKRFLEVSASLGTAKQSLGTLIIGFDLKSVERRTNLVIRRAALMALLLIAINSAFTAMYVETLIRPILNLNQTMKKAGEGDLHVRAPVNRGDEVGELAGAFNRMMDELSEVRDLDRMQRAQLVHTEKMVAVGTLAAGVAHEVRNPLAGVLACVENLRSRPDDEEMRERYLALIQDGLERIEYIIDNLLGFSRSQRMQPEPTSLTHNLKHVVELASYQLRHGGVEVEFDLASEDDTTVLGDHIQMEQLCLNLVLNAIKAMPKGGTLKLSSRLHRGNVVVEVKDSGVGISEENLDRIFDPFFTTREPGKGTGLGLTVSDSIVAAHAGVIEVESVVQEGTLFRVILPSSKAGRARDG